MDGKEVRAPPQRPEVDVTAKFERPCAREALTNGPKNSYNAPRSDRASPSRDESRRLIAYAG